MSRFEPLVDSAEDSFGSSFSKQLLQSIRRYLCTADPPTVHCALCLGQETVRGWVWEHTWKSFWVLSPLLPSSHNQPGSKQPCPQDMPIPTQSAPEHTQKGAGKFSPLSSSASPLSWEAAPGIPCPQPAVHPFIQHTCPGCISRAPN